MAVYINGTKVAELTTDVHYEGSRNIGISVDAVGSGVANPLFDSASDSIAITAPHSKKLVDLGGNEIPLLDLKVGDTVYASQQGIPDRWYGGLVGTRAVFHKIEAGGGGGAGDFVPTTRKVNGYALEEDIELTAEDVGALPSDEAEAMSDKIKEHGGRLDALERNDFDILNSKDRFVHRKPAEGSDQIIDGSVCRINKIGGLMYKFNQLVNPADLPPTQTVNGVTFTNNGDGSITVSGTATSPIQFTIFTAPKTPSEKWDYYLVYGNNPDQTSNMCVGVGSSNKDSSDSGCSMTLTSSGQQLDVKIYISSGTTVDDSTFFPNVHRISDMFGSPNYMHNDDFRELFPSAPYPYDEGSVKIASPTKLMESDYGETEEATFQIPQGIRDLEGYGWGLMDYARNPSSPFYFELGMINHIDFERRKFVQNVVRVDMGELEWELDGDNHFFTRINDKKTIDSYKSCVRVVCSKYITYNWIGSFLSSVDKVIGEEYRNRNRIYVKDTDYDDAEEFREAVSGEYIYYPLATPIEIDISEYLDGNTVTAFRQGHERFDADVSAYADIDYYIERSEGE